MSRIDHDGGPFERWSGPGFPVTSLIDMMPLAGRLLMPQWRNEVVLVALDDQWRSRPGVTVVREVPSAPELLEHLLEWSAPTGQRVCDLLEMRRVVCVSSQVPFRIDPGFDWFDCDAAASRAGVHLVEWIALTPRSTTLPRAQAGVESRWPSAA